ncbi:MAG: phosphoenolpyruvate carboxykinase (ATP) [Thermoplasmata archaeon]|nr:phosphoenolpyruvate carboxykinase (ATP) [Thermoplasmata archaeon]
MQIYNPSDEFFKEFLKPYYVITKDGQHLFASRQKGRRPDRVFYMVPPGYRLGKGQRYFDVEIGKNLFEIAEKYLRKADKIIQEGVQGENGYKVGIKIVTSIENPHSAYISWMGKLMIFPPENIGISCINYIIPEGLPEEFIQEVKEFWDYNNEPLTLFDFTEIDKDIRKVLNLNIDYFGGAFKKPNLTMVWNKAEEEGLISYHAGCCNGRILKGLSGTGKTTLTVGENIEQDDALVGMPIYENGKITKIKLIGLEAGSFAKSEGLNEKSPEWKGLMKSREGAIVLALNIDCEGVKYVEKRIKGYDVIVPVAVGKIGSLKCNCYEESKTTNGRFIFKFSDLNKNWGKREKYLEAEGLSFRRFDILEPIIRVTDANMAVALDSACESVVTSAIEGRVVGQRVRVYSATDFMAREQAEQAFLKLKAYEDLGLGLDGKLVFFVVNTGYVGEHDLNGNATGKGEKIKVEDSKKLIYLVEKRKIRRWLRHPAFGYLIPHPKELEEKHGMKNFGKRFNLLRYYSPEEIIAFTKRDIEERTEFLKNLFAGQRKEKELKDVINVWQRCKIPTEEEIIEFYEEYE